MKRSTLADERASYADTLSDALYPEAAPRRRLRGRAKDWFAIILFVLPALALFVLLVLLPIAIATYTSLFKWSGYVGAPMTYVGLDNFRRLFQDDVFTGDLWRGGLLILFSLGLQLPVALALAMLLNQPLRGRTFYRLLFFAPFVLSEVTTAVLFKIAFSPNRGLIPHLLGGIGLADLGTKVFADPDTVLFSVFVVISWKYFGFHMILYLAGRQNIPKELTEAATTDGATSWQVFRHVTLPLLGPTIRVSVFLSIIGAIQLFDMVWVLTEGGPVHGSETMAVTMYQTGFKRFQFGYATAITITMFLISLVFALFYQRFVMRRDLEGAVTGMGVQR